MKNQQLFLKIEEFYNRLQKGEFDYPSTLAIALQHLADKAWDEVDELYQPSVRIDP